MTSLSEVDVNDALEHAENYVRAFNSGDPAEVNRFYTEDAITVWEKGVALSGAERLRELDEFLAARPQMRATVLESYVTADTALLVVDWAIDIPEGEDGPEHFEGIGLDVLRRGPDGNWLFAIDNPFGKEI